MYYNRIEGLECISYIVLPIGFIIKKSKLLHQWAFGYQGMFHEIKLYDSKYSLNKEVIMNDIVIYPKQKTHQLDISFKIEDIDITLIQMGDEYDLRLNSCSFIHILECNRNAYYFDTKDSTSNVEFNQPSDLSYKQINNVLPLSDFTQNEHHENNKRHPLFTFKIHSTDDNELNERLIM